MIFAVTNQKGGVGKTTTAVNLGAYLAHLGKKVLLVDMDPQANLTSALGKKGKFSGSIYNILLDNRKASDTIITTNIKRLFLLPSDLNLAGSEIELANMIARERILKRALDEIAQEYEYILIDCPPSLGLLTINSLSAADKVIIPLQCEYFALEGVEKLVNAIKLIKDSVNPTLRIGGIVLTMYDKRTNLGKEIIDEAKTFFGDLMFTTIIPRSIRLTESPSFGKTILEYEPESKGAKAYKSLAREFIRRF